MSPQQPYLVAGAIGSPYTRKLKAGMVYRRLPLRFLAAPVPGQSARADLPPPPRPLLPCLYFPEPDGSYRAGSDTTPLIRELERLHAGRSIIPDDPALALLCSLVEDYADEWMTKMMFYYRWGIDECVEFASKILPLWNLGVSDEAVEQFGRTFARRQVDRLSGVVTGRLDVSAPVLEAAYERLLTLLRDRLAAHRFVFGDRPTAADFAIYGQLTQLLQVEPASAAIARKLAPRVMAWTDALEDLSGLEVDEKNGLLSREQLRDELRPLLTEIGRTYAPYMLANETALETGTERLTCKLDGLEYVQKPFPYQRKCLDRLREEYAALATPDRAYVDGALAGTGCGELFAT